MEMSGIQTPYFIFKPESLKENFEDFDDMCQLYLEKYIVAYSVKTNSYLEVIRTLSRLGCDFEVASFKEMLITPKKAAVFNGPCKTDKELRKAVKQMSLINVDSKSEMNKITEIVKGKRFNIGLRISFENSKFGFDEDHLEDAIKYARLRNLDVISLHFHPGTQKTLHDFEENLKNIERVVYKTMALGLELAYINVGGGFPDKFQMKNLSVELKDYFDKIEEYLEKFNTTIVLEPGRYLVADAFELITKVEVIKENFDKTYAILDAGINLLPKITLSPYNFTKLNKNYDEGNESRNKEFILAGPLLFNNDILGRVYGNLKEGDLIRVENVGAYCSNLAWEISYDKPKIYIE
jgi:diaminopimelate decarboxylase